MSKPSKPIIRGLLRLHFYIRLQVNKSKPTFANASSSLSSTFRRHFSSNVSSEFTTLAPRIHSNPPAKPTSSNLGLSHILSTSPKYSHNTSLHLVRPNHKLSSGFKFFSSETSSFGQKVDGSFAKKVLEKPATAVSSAFSRYREAIGLQIDAFFRRNYLFLLGAGGVLLCALLWRIMFGIASTFVGISEGMAKYGFLALSSAVVAFAVSSSSTIFLDLFTS